MHTVRSIHLRVELSDHSGEENHSKSGSQEDIQNNLRKSPECGISDWVSRLVDGENNEDNHELTPEKVAVEVVASVRNTSGLVRNGVAFLVKVTVDRSQTDQGSLSTFNNGQPEDGEDQEHQREDGVDILGNVSLLGKDQTSDQGTRPDKGDGRDDILDALNDRVLLNREACWKCEDQENYHYDLVFGFLFDLLRTKL